MKIPLCPILLEGYQILKILIDAGADLNAESVWGDTAVHYAAIDGTVDSLSYLVESGIKITQNKDKVNNNGMLLSQEYGMSEVCECEMFFFLNIFWGYPFFPTFILCNRIL